MTNRLLRLLLYGVTLSLAGCMSPGTYAGDAEPGDTIELSGFSVDVPHGKGWKVTADKRSQKITISNQTGPKCEIEVFQNTVANRDPKVPLTVEGVADDFREHEKRLMWLYGELPGNYKLENVSMDEIQVGGKSFYYMTFRLVMNEEKAGAPAVVDGVMYLHFPEEFPDPAAFYVLLFKDFYLRDDGPMLADEQVIGVLQSFKIDG